MTLITHELQKYKWLFSLAFLRLGIVLISASVIINSSLLKLILGVELSTFNKITLLLIVCIKFLLGMLIEVIFTTEISFDNEGINISRKSQNRIYKYFIISLLAEIFLFIDVLSFLNSQKFDIQYILAMREGISFFLLLNISYRTIFTWLAILSNIIAIIILLKPDNNDESQKSITTSTIFIFLRNIFLPL